MTQIHNTVFISYRRANQFMAQSVHQNLQHDYDVFIDYKSIGAGSFGDVIFRQIEARAHFLLILTPSALERCSDPDDWLRREIEHAINHKRNIVPLMFAGAKMEDVGKFLMPVIQTLPHYNALNVPGDYFNEAMSRLRQNFLEIPFEMIVQPVLPSDAKVLENIKEEAVTAPAPTEEQLTAEQYFEQGFEHALAGRYSKAIENFSRALSLNSDYPAAYANRGNAYAYQGNFSAALNDLDRAISLSPDAIAYNNRGMIHIQQGKLDAALADFSNAISLDSDLVMPYLNRGNFYAHSGNFDAALTDFDKAVTLDPNFSATYYNRGIVFFQRGAYRDAITDFDTAIDLAPDDADIYYNRGSTYAKLGEFDAAIADYDAVLRINPNDDRAQANLGRARRARDQQP